MDKMAVLDVFQRHCRKVKQLSGDEFQACCPFHKDKRPSLHFKIDGGLYHCKACSAEGNIITFCKAFREDFTSFIDQTFKNGKISSPVAQISPKTDDKQTVDTVMLRIKAEEYSNSLGIEDSFLQYNLMGKDENGRLTFPYFNDNMEVIAIKHHKGKNGEAPYWHKGGDNRAKWYNGWNLPLYKRHKSLIISEGEPDTIKLCRNGFQAICSSAGTNSVPELIPIMKEWI